MDQPLIVFIGNAGQEGAAHDPALGKGLFRENVEGATEGKKCPLQAEG
jgi:hypothetical protein